MKTGHVFTSLSLYFLLFFVFWIWFILSENLKRNKRQTLFSKEKLNSLIFKIKVLEPFMRIDTDITWYPECAMRDRFIFRKLNMQMHTLWCPKPFLMNTNRTVMLWNICLCLGLRRWAIPRELIFFYNPSLNAPWVTKNEN